MQDKKFSLPQFNIEILDKFKSSNTYSDSIANEVISAFWNDYNKFGYSTDFAFVYKELTKTDYEKGCKELGDSLLEGYTTFTKKKENKRNVRDIFISEYYIQQDIYRCQFCGQVLEQSGKINEKITADLEHIIPKSIYPQFALHPKNLVPCCLECNRVEKATNFNFKNDLSDFYKAFSELNLKISQKPFELWKRVSFSNNSNFGMEINLDKNSDAFNLINHYGLPLRYSIMFGQCFQALRTQIKYARVNSPEALERLLEFLTSVSFDDYNGAISFNNSPHIWQDFLNEILYDRCKLESLWEEVKDYNSQLMLY